MIWKGRRGSSNVEDQRGSGMGGRGALPIGGGLGIIIVIIYTLLGGNPIDIINQTQVVNSDNQVKYEQTAQEKELADFVSVVLADTEDVWHELFKSKNLEYRDPKLVMFSGYVKSACGTAGASTGPFYCPGDEKVYIDLSFYKQMETFLKAPGDTAMAYVIAHEVGHHVQNQLGIMDKYQSYRSKMSEKEFNKLTIRLELQADYFAGVWAHYAQNKNLLEEGDIEEAINAAGAVGDDRIQKQTQGYVVPDSFTHGTSEQRTRWFMKGFKTGNFDQMDTFKVKEKDL